MADALQPASASQLPPGVTDPSYKPLPGRLGNLTIPQQHALEKLKKELQQSGDFVPERHDDALLLRFLRARRFDVEKAKAMLLACEQWRKDFGVDDILKNFEFPEKAEVDKYYPQYYHKIDKDRPRLMTLTGARASQDGRPVYIEQLGKLDIGKLYAITTPERQLKRLVYEYEKNTNERMPACSRVIGHPVETSCTILDLNGVSISNFYRVKDYVMQASSVGQDRYPESMGKFYIINAPWAFSAVWSIIKPWLDEVTVSKIDILGRDYKGKLLAQIPADNLPKEFGGKCQCPGGCSLSDAGPWNPAWEQASAEKP
ncbi:hypothetical protein DAEQUDRAFT_718733 [Daedalea quercina L-15889]|uniref:CRAL-TRIO domain-containing protein n=1 Tax=Daedalea quercina L-15889 TaxID=1314783 RepID=A0A165L5U3_9APHY|nr:hypothetical protein DAEQUDRAFT_718733 [Daedalea quercina L-15889]